jgi:phosphatidylserine/phosphatidylglycerophosphate/cardiolipin synthase-like enzyme
VTITVTGRLVDENTSPIPNLHVEMKDNTALFAESLGSADSGNDGTFTFTIHDDLHTGADQAVATPRVLTLYVTSQGGREISTTPHPDATGSALALDDVPLRKADIYGLVVTGLKDTPSTTAHEGNAVMPLVDDAVAWSHLSDSITAATLSVDIMQLTMDMPPTFNKDPAQEQPDIFLAFSETLVPTNPGVVNEPDNTRLERALLSKAASGVTVRIGMSGSDPSEFVKVLETAGEIALALVAAIPVLILYAFNIGPTRSLVHALWHHEFGNVPDGDAAAVRKYFDAAQAADVVTTANAPIVTPFATRLLNVIHAKAAILDANAADETTEAILFGSPFSQCYWDTGEHAIYNARRGPAEGEPNPVHDVSMALRGPVAKDVHDAYLLHWNQNAASGDAIAAITAPAAITTPKDGEAIATVQLVRTIDAKAFPSLPGGETGCLEAYLRAIDNAKSYIYFENQYFTDRAIGKALAAALKDTTRPDLQVILMLNVIPDMPFYPKWQAELIAQIRSDAGAANANRLGAFTAWTHNLAPNSDAGMPWSKQVKPMIMPNYLHTKTAVIDGTWATVGSANLDGASLDYFQILHSIEITDPRNHELNYVIFSGDPYPETTAVDTLRTQLWSEHLGIPDNDPQLATSDTNNKGFLALWRKQSAAKLAALVSDPTSIDTSLGRVLEYPANTTAGYGRAPFVDFLTKAGIDLTKIDLLDTTTAYDFAKGKWK